MVNNQGYYRGRNHLSICLQSYKKNLNYANVSTVIFK